MTLSSGVLGTIGALALLLSLIALAVALSNRRATSAQPSTITPELAPAAQRPAPDSRPREEPAVPAEAGQSATDNAGGGVPMAKITPAPADDQVAAVIAAAITAYLSDQRAGAGSVPVTHVTGYGASGPVWKAAGREAVISSRQSMYGKGYRR
ncbi:MAG: hypothetical protein ACM3XN_00550 [Chloroflexota bacterium]